MVSEICRVVIPCLLYTSTLLFGRNGECALLCDDNNEPDEGIAICIYPKAVIKSQDDYL